MTNDSPSSGGEAGFAGPAQAFQHFYELVEQEGFPFAARDEYLTLVRPFLINPERHDPHVRALFEAASAAQMLDSFERMPLFGSSMRPLFRRLWRGMQKQMLVRLAEMRDHLLEEAEPGQLSFDMLPVRRLAAPPEWEADRRMWLLQAKLAIHPTSGFQPDSVSIRMQLGHAGAQLVEQFPTNEMAELGLHEVELGSHGQFRVVERETAKVSAGLTGGPAKLSSELAASTEAETTVGATSSHKVTYTAKVIRIIASAVGDVARWEMLGAGDERPVGGLDFYATVLLPADATHLPVTVGAIVEFEGWGPLRLEYGSTLALVGPTEALT